MSLAGFSILTFPPFSPGAPVFIQAQPTTIRSPSSASQPLGASIRASSRDLFEFAPLISECVHGRWTRGRGKDLDEHGQGKCSDHILSSVPADTSSWFLSLFNPFPHHPLSTWSHFRWEVGHIAVHLLNSWTVYQGPVFVYYDKLKHGPSIHLFN